jgi:hypothetical protein
MGKCLVDTHLICVKSHQLSITFYDGWKLVPRI